MANGNEWMNDRDSIERANSAISRISPSLWVRPYGPDRGEANDHVHIDIGYAILEPRGAMGEDPEEAGRVEQQKAEA